MSKPLTDEELDGCDVHMIAEAYQALRSKLAEADGHVEDCRKEALDALEKLAFANTEIAQLRKYGAEAVRERDKTGEILELALADNTIMERERDEARTIQHAEKKILLDTLARLAALKGALERLRDGADAPEYHYSSGMGCGAEDRDLQGDGYEGAAFGWSDAEERFLEWARNEADAALADLPAADELLAKARPHSPRSHRRHGERLRDGATAPAPI